MADIRIPADFKPLIAGYSFDGTAGAVMTEVEGGSNRFGRRFRRGPQQFRVSLNMRPAKLSVWTAFYFHLIDEGTERFIMPLDSGAGLEDHFCNVVPGSYSAVRAANSQITVVSFVVSAISTVWNMTQADAQAIVDFWNASSGEGDALLRRIDQFASGDSRVLGF